MYKTGIVPSTIGYTRKQANKEWFDEECAKVNEEKHAARERSQECLQTSPDKNEAFVQKKGKTARRRGFNRD
jgi:hypothetical protein